MARRRVVITGLGAVTVLGSSVQQFWEGLQEGRSGVRRITQFDASGLACQIAGEIPDFNVEDYMEKKEARRMARSVTRPNSVSRISPNITLAKRAAP